MQGVPSCTSPQASLISCGVSGGVLGGNALTDLISLKKGNRMNIRTFLIKLSLLAGLATTACAMGTRSMFPELEPFFRDFDSLCSGGAVISVDDYTSDDKKNYGIKITLPGFGPDDVTVHVNNQDGKKVVEIEAKEKPKRSDDEKVDVIHHVAHSHYSSSEINGKRTVKEKKIEQSYQDGVHTIKVYLPETVNDDTHTMTFVDEVLTLEFALKSKQPTGKRRLNFTNMA